MTLADAMMQAVGLLNDGGWIALNDPTDDGRVRTRIVASRHRAPHGAGELREAATGHAARNLAVLALAVGSPLGGEAARRAFALIDALCELNRTPVRELSVEAIQGHLGCWGDRVRVGQQRGGRYRGRATPERGEARVAWGDTHAEALAGLCAQSGRDGLAWAALRLALGGTVTAALCAPHTEEL